MSSVSELIVRLVSAGNFHEALRLADTWVTAEPENIEAVNERSRLELLLSACPPSPEINDSGGSAIHDSIRNAVSDVMGYWLPTKTPVVQARDNDIAWLQVVCVNPCLYVDKVPTRHEWLVEINSAMPLRYLLLYGSTDVDNCFRLSSIRCSVRCAENVYPLQKVFPASTRQWASNFHPFFKESTSSRPYQYCIKVEFSTQNRVSCQQHLIFVFDTPQCLSTSDQRITCAYVTFDVSCVSESERFDTNASQTPDNIVWQQASNSKTQRQRYDPISSITNAEYLTGDITAENYKMRMHALLFEEELAQKKILTRFEMTTIISLMDIPNSESNASPSTPESPSDGTQQANDLIIAQISMPADLSLNEDTSSGRLLLRSCKSLLLRPTSLGSEASALPQSCDDNTKSYEATIERISKSNIILSLSPQCSSDLQLTSSDIEKTVKVEFVFDRSPFIEMHAALHKSLQLQLVVPDLNKEIKVPWSTDRQWNEFLEPYINPKQREAVIAVTSDIDICLPPVLITGPFGTGKTFTLAKCIRILLEQPDSRVLLCTHSNSAADLYMTQYLHNWVSEGLNVARPLRIYYTGRTVSAVDPTVLPYCLIENGHKFRNPTLEELHSTRVVIVTLHTSKVLSDLDLPNGYFTHILIDEASQALEAECLIPLSFAGPKTRVALAGDYMQMSPETYSPLCKSCLFDVSLLERLYHLYPPHHPCLLKLVENYRSHPAILEMASKMFYQDKLVASGKQLAHLVFFPITFFAVRGTDIQHTESTNFYNEAEVTEVCDRVEELFEKWPVKDWNEPSPQSVAVITPYWDQVIRIRAELRRRQLADVVVERVANVQGKQFKAIFISTVRTLETHQSRITTSNRHGNSDEDDVLTLGFLSEPRLLNTALTRAQCLVSVVGDPVCLCSVGRCREVWEKVLEAALANNSLYGMSWNQINHELNGIKLRKMNILNPHVSPYRPSSDQARAPSTSMSTPSVCAPASNSNYLLNMPSYNYAPYSLLGNYMYQNPTQQAYGYGGYDFIRFQPQMFDYIPTAPNSQLVTHTQPFTVVPNWSNIPLHVQQNYMFNNFPISSWPIYPNHYGSFVQLPRPSVHEANLHLLPSVSGCPINVASPPPPYTRNLVLPVSAPVLPVNVVRPRGGQPHTSASTESSQRSETTATVSVEREPDAVELGNLSLDETTRPTYTCTTEENTCIVESDDTENRSDSDDE